MQLCYVVELYRSCGPSYLVCGLAWMWYDIKCLCTSSFRIPHALLQKEKEKQVLNRKVKKIFALLVKTLLT